MSFGRRGVGYVGLAACAFALSLQLGGAKLSGSLFILRYFAAALGLLALSRDLTPRRPEASNLRHFATLGGVILGLGLAFYVLSPAIEFYFARQRARASLPVTSLIVIRKDLRNRSVLLYAPAVDRYEWFDPVHADFLSLSESRSIKGFVLEDRIVPKDLTPDHIWLGPLWLILSIALWFAFGPLGGREIFSRFLAPVGAKLNILGAGRRGENPTP